ncbi:MAG: ribosome hibernation-promoting factor, HPF/YfiA family, partial [Anaerolineales bacterium]
MDEKLYDYVNKKASNLDRYINSIEQGRVDLIHVKGARSANDRYKAQITLQGKGYVLRAEEKADQIHAAFDTALDKIQRQIERYKGKTYKGKSIAAAANDQALAEVLVQEEEEEPFEVVRRKKFLLYPMNEQEAVEQMRLLGHENFFVFYNMDAGCVSVL